MPRKKIVFVIVEGPSDEDALGVILNRFYRNNNKEVYVHVTHCDVTTKSASRPEDNIITEIAGLVQKYARRRFKPEDFSQIIHIADTDGAFIPDDAVVKDSTAANPVYSVTEIRTQRKTGIEARNRHKRENLDKLSSTPAIWKIPYRIYYMSCNLDHVLYGKLNSPDEEKENDSYAFAKKYRDDIPGFIRFISESDFSVMNNYRQSWQYIREGLHSLERHSNFGLSFQTEDSDAEIDPQNKK